MSIFFSGTLFASVDINLFFNPTEISKVVDKDIISKMFVKYNKRGENTHTKIEIAKSKWTDDNFNNYEILCDERAFFPFDLTDKSKLDLYNIITNGENLSGMEYYSRSAKKVEKLIVNAFNIDNKLQKNRIDKTSYTNIEPSIEKLFQQEDNKFGKLIFKSTIINEDNDFVIINTNETPVVNMVKICNIGEYKIITFLIYSKEHNGYFYYSINAMRIIPDFLLKNGFLRPTTFSNRLRALYIHLLKGIGIDKIDRLNPWDEEKLKNGDYFVK